MKFKFGINKREKTLISILITVVVMVIYFSIFFRPIIRNLSMLMPKVSELSRDLSSAKFLIENKEVIEKQKENYRLKIDKYAEIFPSEQEIPKLLENLSIIASESNVKIVGIKPLSKKDVGSKEEDRIYQEIPIEIIAKSGYHQLGRFLQKLEMGDRFITVKDIKIKADSRNPKRHDVRLIASTYILVKR